MVSERVQLVHVLFLEDCLIDFLKHFLQDSLRNSKYGEEKNGEESFINIQGVSQGIVNILGGGSLDYYE